MSTDQPDMQADMQRVVEILTAAPACGLSLDEIQRVTEAGEKWSYRTINAVLFALGKRVRSEKVRVRQSKLTKYTLRSKSE